MKIIIPLGGIIKRVIETDKVQKWLRRWRNRLRRRT